MPTLDVIVDADTRGVARGLDDAERRFGGLGSIASRGGLAVAAGLATAGAAAIKFGVDSIGAASDLNETLNRSKIIFGNFSDEIEAFGDTAATNLGLSKAAAIDAATGFGNMFTQLGQNKAEAAATSTQVVQLAADLGSFNNLDTADVNDRIAAAFRGEYDSLQTLIPNINAARVEKEALAATGKTVASELTAEEKAMAALSIITKDGSKAQGDFERTSGGLANQQKILHARFEDVQATLGQKVLPYATSAVSTLNDMLDGSDGLGRSLRTRFGPALEIAGDVLGDLIEVGKEFFHWFIEEIAPSLDDDLFPVLKALAAGFETIRQKVKENEPELRDLLGALGDITEFIVQDVLPIVSDLIGVGLEPMIDTFGRAIDGIALLVDWFNTAKGAVEDLIDAIGRIHVPDLPDLPGLGGLAGLLPKVSLGDLGRTLGEGRTQNVTIDVKLDGGFIGDEAALAAKLSDTLGRHFTRNAVQVPGWPQTIGMAS